jgi:hypothetical protein
MLPVYFFTITSIISPKRVPSNSNVYVPGPPNVLVAVENPASAFGPAHLATTCHNLANGINTHCINSIA